MKWLVNLKRKFYNSPKIKQQILFYSKDIIEKQNIEELEEFQIIFGEYIFNNFEEFSENFFNFSKGLTKEEKMDFLFNMIRTAILYKTSGKLCSFDLLTEKEKKILEKSSDYFLKTTEKDGYYELNGYKLPKNFYLKEIFYDRLSLEKTVKDYYKQKDIIDAGACLGDSSLILSEYTDKNVHAFEPSEKNYQLLLKTIELNKKTNIIPVKYGLGDSSYKANLKNYNSEDEIGSLTIKNKETEIKETEEIQVITLDDYVEKNDIEVGLIKADIEGFEQNLLKGAKMTIERFKPILLICIYHSTDDFFNIKKIIEDWDLGYNIRYIPATFNGHFIVESMIIAEPF